MTAHEYLGLILAVGGFFDLCSAVVYYNTVGPGDADEHPALTREQRRAIGWMVSTGLTAIVTAIMLAVIWTHHR